MNNKNIKVVDEHSIDRNASVMFAFDLEGREYVIYWIERDEDNSNIFVSKVIKNLDGTFNMLDIDDSMEKSKLSDIIKILITTAVNSEADKVDGNFVTLSDGKVVKFITVSFNKEQRINVQKTYITTVKKEVVRVAEKYYDVEVNLEQPMIFEDIFPTVAPVIEESHDETKEVIPELIVPNIEQSVNLNEEISVATPVIPQPVATTSVLENAYEEKTDSFISFGTEETVPKVEESLLVDSTITSVAEVPNVVSTPTPAVVESITVAEPIVDVVSSEPVNELSNSEKILVEPLVVTSSVASGSNNDVSQPLVFNAAKESNLNAALGEVASSNSIPVVNIAPVREFGVDSVVKTSTESAINNPVQADVINGQKAGFANSKFFVVVAVAFFLAACIFLGYEVYNYFQLTK